MTNSAAEALRHEIANEAASEVAQDVANRCASQVAAALLTAAKELDKHRGGAESVPAERRYFSVAHLAAFFQIPGDLLRELARRAGVEPSLALNDVCHYSMADIPKIASFIAQVRERHAKEELAE